MPFGKAYKTHKRSHNVLAVNINAKINICYILLEYSTNYFWTFKLLFFSNRNC